MHLDKKLKWRKHIAAKRKQINIKLHDMYWLLGKHSSLSMSNKTMIYKMVLKPIWTYGLQLWGTASNSNIEIIQLFQNKILRLILKAPKYVPLIRDLQLSTVKQVITDSIEKYKSRLKQHTNQLAKQLLLDIPTRRLKRHGPLELAHRLSN